MDTNDLTDEPAREGAGGPLSGMLVVALEQAVAAPFASCRLADAGARVIKIERAAGDFARAYDHVVNGDSAYFVWLNRGKESLVLNIKQADDKALLENLLAQADVFIQNLAPGAAERAGFGSDDLRARFPKLITCDISGYGEDGSYADMKAYDLLVQAETGLCSITGSGHGPSRVGVSVCDIAAGMAAHAGIVEALLARERTGEGSGVKVSLFDGMADWMAVPLLHYDYGGKAPAASGLRHPSIAPYAAFPTKDGKSILISIQNEREWALFADRIMGHPEWAEEGPYADGVSRVQNRDALEAEITAVFSADSGGTLAAKLAEAGIAFGFVNGVDGLSEHPVLRRVAVETPHGTAEVPAPPIQRSSQAPGFGTVPEIGQHTDKIREEFSA